MSVVDKSTEIEYSPKPSCIDCGGVKSTKKTLRCIGCYRKKHRGEGCYQYKGGKKDCILCGKKTTQYNAKVCKRCKPVYQSGKNNPSWKGGVIKIKSLCECGKKKYPYSDKCRLCWKKLNVGENHPNWTGGNKYRDIHSLFNPEYVQWRSSVFKRDNWKCRIENNDCKGQLEAHHILPWREFVELRYIINNGITLCHAHHPRKRAEEKRLIPEFQKLVSVSNRLTFQS